MVFSTLHTMSASATVHRLLDMGAAGYMIGAAIHGIVAQRLVRRTCENCAQPAPPSPQELTWLRARLGARAAQMQFKVGSGCTYCNLSGYRGRMAVYELLEIDSVLADASRRGNVHDVDNAVRTRAGYVSLAQSALDLAGKGTTSLSEAIGVASGMEESVEARDALIEEALDAETLATA
jgi:MSHA biogenesis protein MshE